MKNLFLTGSTGFLGGELCKRLLIQQPDSHFYLLIRNRAKLSAANRFTSLVSEWAAELSLSLKSLEERVHLVEGDLLSPSLGLCEVKYNQLAQKMDVIFHLAASIDLLGKYNKLYRTNVEGTLQLLTFAEAAKKNGGLERFHYCSTAYVSGKQRGVVFENDLDKGQSFSNDYEFVKMQAEKAVQAAKLTLPVTVYRPSIVVGDSQNGYAPHDCATLDFVKLILTGKMPFIPCANHLKADIVPVDYVADAIAHLSSLADETLGQTYHLVAGKDRCISSIEIAKIAKSVIEVKQRRKGNYGRLRLPVQLHPLLAIAASWVCSRLKTNIPSKLIQFWMTYAKYNWYCREFDDLATTQLLEKAGIHKPSIRSGLRVMMHRNLTTDQLHNWVAANPKGKVLTGSGIGQLRPFWMKPASLQGSME